MNTTTQPADTPPARVPLAALRVTGTPAQDTLERALAAGTGTVRAAAFSSSI